MPASATGWGQSQSGQLNEDASRNKSKKNAEAVCSSAAESLPDVCEALGSIASTVPLKQKEFQDGGADTKGKWALTLWIWWWRKGLTNWVTFYVRKWAHGNLVDQPRQRIGPQDPSWATNLLWRVRCWVEHLKLLVSPHAQSQPRACTPSQTLGYSSSANPWIPQSLTPWCRRRADFGQPCLQGSYQ